MTDWYYHDPRQGRVGPVPADELRRRVQAQNLPGDTLVWHAGLGEWEPLRRVAHALGLSELSSAPVLPPPLPSSPVPGASGARPAQPQKKMSGCLVAALIGGGVLAVGVPILAILAAIAIPAYQDYTVRAKVQQAVAETASLKIAIQEHALQHGACPDTDSESLASLMQQLQKSPFTQAVQVGTLENGACAYELTFRNIGQDTEGKTLLFAADNDGNTTRWDCTGGDLPSARRPMECRSTP